MKLHFYKYQGAGNDFVLIDNRLNEIDFTEKIVEYLCDRRFGVGGDGLMLLQKSSIADFVVWSNCHILSFPFAESGKVYSFSCTLVLENGTAFANSRFLALSEVVSLPK